MARLVWTLSGEHFTMAQFPAAIAPTKGHQRKIQGIVPRRDDEHHAIRFGINMIRRGKESQGTSHLPF